MQTTKRPTGLRTLASDYVTLVQQAKNKIKGFEQLYKELKCAEVIKAQLPARVVLPLKATTKEAPAAYQPKQCPCCKKDTVETLMRFQRRGPPPDWKILAQDLLACITGTSATS
jgi:hypothetical protein